MNAACNMLTTLPICWTHLLAFASGAGVFAVVFFCSGRLFSWVSPGYRALGTDKQTEVRYNAALGVSSAIVAMLAWYVSFSGNLSLDMISKDIPVVRHTSAFNLGYLLADLVISNSVPVAVPHSPRTFGGGLHHAISAFGELMSLVYGFDPYVVVFHQRMDLTAPLALFRFTLQTLGVSRDAPGFLALWVGSLTLYLCIRVLVLPFYWYNTAPLMLTQMEEIKRCGYGLSIVLFVCVPSLHVLNIYWWSRGFMSFKRYLTNRKAKAN